VLVSKKESDNFNAHVGFMLNVYYHFNVFFSR